MDIYEESLPDYTDYEDYTVHYVEPFESYIPSLTDQSLKHTYKPLEEYKIKHYLINLFESLNEPNKITTFIKQINQGITRNSEPIQLFYIKTIHDLILKIINNKLTHSVNTLNETQYKNLILFLIDEIIKMINNFQDNICTEYYSYFDKIIYALSSNKIYFNITEGIFGKETIEYILGLGKFGQEKRNRKLCLFLCTKILQISNERHSANSNNNINDDSNSNSNNSSIKIINKIINRLFILLEDGEQIVRLQSAKELNYLIPLILNYYIIENNREEMVQIISGFLRDIEDHSVKIISLISIFNNINLLLNDADSNNNIDINSNNNNNSQILIKINNTFNSLFSYDKWDNKSNDINNFIELFKILLLFIQKNNENIYLFKETINNFLENMIFIKKDDYFINENYTFLFENIDLFLKCYYKVNKQDWNVCKSFLDRLITYILIINNNNKLSVSNMKIIYDLFIKNIHQLIIYINKNNIDTILIMKNLNVTSTFNNTENILIYSNLNLLMQNISLNLNSKNNNKYIIYDEIIIKNSINNLMYFINNLNKYFLKYTELLPINNELIYLKGIKKFIILLSTLKIKEKNELLKIFFNQIKDIISKNTIYKVKNYSIKVIVYIIKYTNYQCFIDEYLNYIWKIYNNGYYNRRIIYNFFKYSFKLFDYNTLSEYKIIDYFIDLFNGSNIAVELISLIDALLYNYNIGILIDNCNNINKIIDKIKDKNNSIFNDIELTNKINQLDNAIITYRGKIKYNETIRSIDKNDKKLSLNDGNNINSINIYSSGSNRKKRNKIFYNKSNSKSLSKSKNKGNNNINFNLNSSKSNDNVKITNNTKSKNKNKNKPSNNKINYNKNENSIENNNNININNNNINNNTNINFCKTFNGNHKPLSKGKKMVLNRNMFYFNIHNNQGCNYNYYKNNIINSNNTNNNLSINNNIGNLSTSYYYSNNTNSNNTSTKNIKNNTKIYFHLSKNSIYPKKKKSQNDFSSFHKTFENLNNINSINSINSLTNINSNKVKINLKKKLTNIRNHNLNGSKISIKNIIKNNTIKNIEIADNNMDNNNISTVNINNNTSKINNFPKIIKKLSCISIGNNNIKLTKKNYNSKLHNFYYANSSNYPQNNEVNLFYNINNFNNFNNLNLNIINNISNSVANNISSNINNNLNNLTPINYCISSEKGEISNEKNMFNYYQNHLMNNSTKNNGNETNKNKYFLVNQIKKNSSVKKYDLKKDNLKYNSFLNNKNVGVNNLRNNLKYINSICLADELRAMSTTNKKKYNS